MTIHSWEPTLKSFDICHYSFRLGYTYVKDVEPQRVFFSVPGYFPPGRQAVKLSNIQTRVLNEIFKMLTYKDCLKGKNAWQYPLPQGRRYVELALIPNCLFPVTLVDWQTSLTNIIKGSFFIWPLGHVQNEYSNQQISSVFICIK